MIVFLLLQMILQATCLFFIFLGTLLLESKINLDTAYQKQQVSVLFNI